MSPIGWQEQRHADSLRPVLISGALVLDPLGELHRPPQLDILINDGEIVALGEQALNHGRSLGAELIDATGYLVTPGFINAHCHSHDTLLRGLFEQLPLEVWGHTAFPFHWTPRTAEEVGVRTRLHAVECLRGGMTTIQDMVTLVDSSLDHAHALAASYAETGIEALVAQQFSDLSGAAGIPFVDECFSRETKMALGRASDLEELKRLTIQLFEVKAHRFSWALGPVQPQICSDDLLKWVRTISAERNLRVFTHLYETRREAILARTTLSQHKKSLVCRLENLGFLNERLAVAHGVWIAPHEIAILARYGVNLTTNPITNLKLMNGIAPLVQYYAAGVTIGIGSDNSSASDLQSTFQGMKMFALAWGMQESASESSAAARAFESATLGGARVLGLADQVGRVAPRFRANLVFIDLNDPIWRPMNSAVRQLVYAETGRSVRHVLVQGQWVVLDGRCTMIDEDKLAHDAERLREQMSDELQIRMALPNELVASYRRVIEMAEEVPLPIEPRSLILNRKPI
jgi:cytosine/adenosine deaminase-related metal-dependent hydrolase